MDTVERFVTNLFAAFSKPPRRETAEFYIERLMRWHRLTPENWSHACSLIVSHLDRFPTLSQIYPFLVRAYFGTGDELVPVWATREWKGKCYAKKTGRMANAIASEREKDQWRLEMAKPDEALASFRVGYLATGGDLDAFDKALKLVKSKTPMFSRVRKSGHGVFDEEHRIPTMPERADYDDSPDEAEA